MLPLLNKMIGLVFLISLIFFLKPLTYDNFPDFNSYYRGTKALLSNTNYYMFQGKVMGDYLYPPPSVLFFLPFTKTALYSSGIIFTALSITGFALSLYYLYTVLKIKLFSKSCILLTILSLFFFPAKFTLGMGQVNNFVLLAMVLFTYFYIKNKSFFAGLFVSLAILMKVFPVIFLLLIVVKKRWKMLVFVFLVSTVLCMLSYIILGHEIFFSFFSNVLPSLMRSTPGDYYNQSLAGFLSRITNIEIISMVIRPLVGSVLSGLSFYLIWINRKGKDWSTLFSIGNLILLYLIINGVAWQHHFVFALIPLIVTFTYIKKHALSLANILLLSVSYLLMSINLEYPNNFPILIRSHVLYGALILYFLDAYFLFHLNQNTASKIESKGK